MARRLGVLAVIAAAVAAALGDSATVAPTPAAAPATRPANAPPRARVTDEGWFLDPKRSARPPKLPEKVEHVFTIPIHGPISGTTAKAVRRKIVRARTGGAQMIIFDMDTPGGLGDAMRDIVRMITDDLPGVYTVAWVHPEAYSAGAIISLACHEIVVTSTAVIGDAMPILLTPGGVPQALPTEIRAKLESPILAEVRTLADRNGYNQVLVAGMITMKLEVWLIRHRLTGELRIVDAEQWRGRVADAPVTTQPEPTPPTGDGPWVYLRTIDRADKLVTLTAKEAVFLGLARKTADSLEQLRAHYHIAADPAFLADTWAEKLAAFLTSPAVMSLLFFVGIFCAYMELNTPGFGAPGIIAVACFALLFGGQYLTGLANWWEIALLLLGVVLIVVEVFVTPGFGVAGIAGILCLVVALLAMLIANPPDKLPFPETDLEWSVFTNGLFALLLGFVCAVVAVAALSRYLPKVPIASKLFLRPAETYSGPPVSDDSPMKAVKVGDVGTVEGQCRPVGMVRFGEDLLPASSEGGVIEHGARVRVLRNEGNRVVVEEIREG